MKTTKYRRYNKRIVSPAAFITCLPHRLKSDVGEATAQW